MQLELFDFPPIELPMRMVLDTRDFTFSGQTPEQAIATIQKALDDLPEGSQDAILQVTGGPSDLHQVCRIVFKRPQTEEERVMEQRYRLRLVVA